MFVRVVDDVRAWFVLRGIASTVVDGIESRNEQTNFGPDSSGRVAFVPAPGSMTVAEPSFIGDGDDGRRQLLNVMAAFDVSFAGYDANLPYRDLAHRQVCFDLFEATAQAVQRTYFGAHTWSAPRWSDDRKIGRHGAELIVTLTLNVPLFDIDYQLAAPDAVPTKPTP